MHSLGWEAQSHDTSPILVLSRILNWRAMFATYEIKKKNVAMCLPFWEVFLKNLFTAIFRTISMTQWYFYAPNCPSLPNMQADGGEGTHLSPGGRRRMDGVPLSWLLLCWWSLLGCWAQAGGLTPGYRYSCDQRMELRAEVCYQENGRWAHVIWEEWEKS